jgi:hypothetical protein
VALRRRAVRELDDVRAFAPRAGAGADGPDPEPDVDAIVTQGVGDDLRVAGVIGRGEPVARLDDRHGDAEAGVDLRELAAGRATTEDQ